MKGVDVIGLQLLPDEAETIRGLAAGLGVTESDLIRQRLGWLPLVEQARARPPLRKRGRRHLRAIDSDLPAA